MYIKRSDAEFRNLGPGIGSSKKRPDACRKLPDSDRLAHAVIRAGIQKRNTVCLLRKTGQNDYRQIARNPHVPKPAKQGKRISLRRNCAENNQLRKILLDCLKEFRCLRIRLRYDSETAERFRHGVADFCIILKEINHAFLPQNLLLSLYQQSMNISTNFTFSFTPESSIIGLTIAKRSRLHEKTVALYEGIPEEGPACAAF